MAHGTRDGLLHGQNKDYDHQALAIDTSNDILYEKCPTLKIRQSTIEKLMSQVSW